MHPNSPPVAARAAILRVSLVWIGALLLAAWWLVMGAAAGSSSAPPHAGDHELARADAAPASATGKAYVVTRTMARDAVEHLDIPKHDPADGTLTKVTIRASARFAPPSWYEGDKEWGACFRVRDNLPNLPNPASVWWGTDCPVPSGMQEGDPGGPWTTVHCRAGGQTQVRPRVETGIVHVADTYDPFGGWTVEVHGEDVIDEDELVYTTELERWTGAGAITWTLDGSYGGNEACIDTGTSSTGGWQTRLVLEVLYSFEP